MVKSCTKLSRRIHFQYIHVESNHLPNIIKQIAKTIEQRLSQLSSYEKILDESAPFYKSKSGYQ